MYEPAQQSNAIYFCASDDNVCKSFIPMAKDEVKIINDSFKEGQRKPSYWITPRPLKL